MKYRPAALTRLRALLAWAAVALPTLAGAVAYTFPGNLPSQCNGSGGNYTCNGFTGLAYGDTVTISGTKPATITINGNFNTNTSQINQSGNDGDLNLIVKGALTLGNQARIKANITANSVSDAGAVVIGGNLTANGGNILLAYLTTVSGNVSTSGTGRITTPQSGSIGGNVSAGTGAISISESGSVAGSVTGSGSISVVQSATVSGSVSAGSGAVDLGYQSRVNGNITSTGTITLGQSSTVGGNITGGAGNVSLGYDARVAGALTTSSGTITVGQIAKASSCVRSTSSAIITLGYQSSVDSVCCGVSCSDSCVTNNSNSAIPPLCTGTPPTLVADYRMDEKAGWNGTAAEVKDGSGNGHHARSATASTGTRVATTASTSPAYGTTSAGSCSYGVFNRASPSATHAYVQLPGSFPSMTGSFTVMAWIRSTAPTQSGQRIISNDDSDNGWALSLGDVGSASVRLFNRNLNASGSVTTAGSNRTGASNANCSGGTFCLDSAPIIAANTWYYVAAVVDTNVKQVQTLIYNTSGTLLASATSAYTGTWVAGSGGSAIGGESINSSEGQNSSFHFYGNIDELQVYNGVLTTTAIAAQLSRSRSCSASTVAGFTISGTGSASTCTPQTLTLTAKDSSGATLTSYTGTVNLSTSSGRGVWSAGTGPAPSGTLTLGAANSGLASYTFAAADNGIVKLQLAHSLAQNVSVTAVDSAVASASSTSGAINYRDNAFVWSEDAGGLIRNYNITPSPDILFVAVAGRPHDMRVALWKKDTTTGNCDIATDYTGSRNLKLWRTDSGGTWTAPTATSNITPTPAAITVGTTRPAGNNLSLNFTAGVATFNLGTTDIGKYAFSLDDDSLTYAATTVSGTSTDLTVRPYTIAVHDIKRGSLANPAGAMASDGVLGPAGANFSATVAAYRWTNASDANNDGVPDSGTNFAAITAGGLAPSFNTAVTLSLLSGSQTPAGGVLGSLSNAEVKGFSGGTVTVNNLKYSEVGSFQLNNQGVINAGSFLDTPGLSLDAVTFAANGTQNPRVGRFVPAGFTLGNPSIKHRANQGCGTASTFTYLDETFELGFDLTAKNAAGAPTLNYIDDPSITNYQGNFARLNIATADFKLAGVAGATLFKPGNGSLVPDAGSGSWTNGVGGVTLPVKVPRLSSTPVGPFDTAVFGVAPVDADGVTMVWLDLNSDGIAGSDTTQVGSAVPLRFGRLRLQNGIGPAARPLSLALEAQYWNGTAYITNALDSCTAISDTNLSFGNLRRSLDADDAAMVGSTATVTQGKGRLTLAAPAIGHVGTLDVAIALDSATPPTDQSCLRTTWTPTKAATTGSKMTALRAPWCGSAFSDPAARATWGVYRGADGVVYQRENY
jgi:MSHA biogenesis protein MshQ